MTDSVTRYRRYAADCVDQAQSEDSTDERNIMLNVALAWLRLAQQAEALNQLDALETSGPVDLDDAHHSFDRRGFGQHDGRDLAS